MRFRWSRIYRHLHARKLKRYLILGGVIYLCWPIGQEYFYQHRAEAVRVSVVDGDTFRVGERRLRLLGMDAPESRQNCQLDGQDWACGTAATAYMEELVAEAEVTCWSAGYDHYQRELARCSADGQDVARRMIANGYAVPYGQDPRAWWLMAQAWLEKKGIWRSEFTWPSRWRAMQR